MEDESSPSRLACDRRCHRTPRGWVSCDPRPRPEVHLSSSAEAALLRPRVHRLAFPWKCHGLFPQKGRRTTRRMKESEVIHAHDCRRPSYREPLWSPGVYRHGDTDIWSQQRSALARMHSLLYVRIPTRSHFRGSLLPVRRSSWPDIGDHEGAGLVPVLMGTTCGRFEHNNSTLVTSLCMNIGCHVCSIYPLTGLKYQLKWFEEMWR